MAMYSPSLEKAYAVKMMGCGAAIFDEFLRDPWGAHWCLRTGAVVNATISSY